MYIKIILSYLLIIFSLKNISALEDDLLKSIEIASSGNKFQAERLKIATENLANEHSVGASPGELPYRRKVIFGKNNYDRKIKAHLLKVKKYSTDKSPFKFRYDPNHPSADMQGYVKLPNVDRNIERADASEAQRSYEAGVSVIEVSKSMIQRTLELIK